MCSDLLLENPDLHTKSIDAEIRVVRQSVFATFFLKNLVTTLLQGHADDWYPFVLK